MILDLIEIALLGLVVWLTWPRSTGPRRTRLQALRPTPQPTDAELSFRGAVPPERFVVVRWPQGLKHYGGCLGAQARTIYEHNHPAPGESVEFWELGECRGRKVG